MSSIWWCPRFSNDVVLKRRVTSEQPRFKFTAHLTSKWRELILCQLLYTVSLLKLASAKKGQTPFPLHCVHFRYKLEQKRFLAKLGLEPGTTRVSTGGCLNHSATQQVITI